jgi:hypothetical protein
MPYIVALLHIARRIAYYEHQWADEHDPAISESLGAPSLAYRSTNLHCNIVCTRTWCYGHVKKLLIIPDNGLTGFLRFCAMLESVWQDFIEVGSYKRGDLLSSINISLSIS